jgi:hypothetical protein
MANKSDALQLGNAIDHTPVGAVTAGKIIQVGNLNAFAPRAIAAAELGSIQVANEVIRGPYVGGIANVGDNVWWDANGTPYGGAADGAFTTNAAAGDWWVGTLVAPTVAASATCDIALNRETPGLPAWQNKTHFTTAADLTLVAATHSGGVIHVTKDAGLDTKITLPTGVVGMDFVIQTDEADAVSLLQIDLDGNEIIAGANLTIAATKLALNTLLTSKRGDFLHLVCNVAATSWRCVGKRGIWVTSA